MYNLLGLLVIIYLVIDEVFSRHVEKSCRSFTERNVIKESTEYSYGILGPDLSRRFTPNNLTDYIHNLPLLCKSLTEINCKYKNPYFKHGSFCLNYTLSEMKWSTTFIISSKTTCEGDYCKLQPDPELFDNVYKNLHTALHGTEKWPIIRHWASQYVPESLPDPSSFSLSVKVFGTDQVKLWMRVLTIKATLTDRDQDLTGSLGPTEASSTFYLPLKSPGGGIITRFGVAYI